MSREIVILEMDQLFTFGKFMGLTLRQAIEKNPREVLRMNNLGYFALEKESRKHLIEALL